ncbi:phasin family protein [Bradyrhizobium sp. CB82]|uniref:phasin family protein n=1 Tax=Bradyrhizobium sp. CB82 TaxID=3039159 RepID=UPI0024B1E866|nr:phasin family protein [Bradyrhizobium sp. CB82]WFU43722.1 phasin family protein [Bradyrhizobium sp. CB82]
MDKPQSRMPADGARARRRSLVELTAAMSRSIDESLVEMPKDPVVVSREDGPRGGRTARTVAQKTIAQKTTVQKTTAMVPACSAQAENCDGTTDLAAEIDDVQTRSLEAMRLGVQAGSDSTEKLVRLENDLLEGTAAECHAVLLELVKLNAGATLQYTRELSRARTVSELIELSSSHARRQCELVLQQGQWLKSLVQNVTRTGAE